MASDPLQVLAAELSRWEKPPRFWWRDDDTRQTSPAFLRMLEWAERLQLPGLLSVIPSRVEPDVPDALAPFDRLKLAQHGWAHVNHSPPGVHKSEFGKERSGKDVLHDLETGFGRMQELFPSRFLPVLVPPFNDIGGSHLPLLGLVGLKGISIDYRVRLPRSALSRADAHVDLLDGLIKRAPAERVAPFAIGRMCGILAQMRREGSGRPFGLLTHHGDMFSDGPWTVVAGIVQVTRNHGCEWADPEPIFANGPGEGVVSESARKLARSAVSFLRGGSHPEG